MTHHTCAGPTLSRTEPACDGSTVFLRGSDGAYDLDVVFDILSDRRRRIVLNQLRTAGESGSTSVTWPRGSQSGRSN